MTDRVAPMFSLERVQYTYRYLCQHQVFVTPQPAIDFFETQHGMELYALTVLAHGDFYARHLLINDQRQLSAIID